MEKMVCGKPNRLPVERGLPAPDSCGANFPVLDELQTDIVSNSFTQFLWDNSLSN